MKKRQISFLSASVTHLLGAGLVGDRGLLEGALEGALNGALEGAWNGALEGDTGVGQLTSGNTKKQVNV